MVVIPPDLLQALASPGGGQIALVIGAGCSLEPPTGIPLAGDLAEAVERQLVLNGDLLHGQCPNPRDLAALAELVFKQTGSQERLVRCFPLERMRLARPNLGYKLLVALMAEGAINHVLSLNFDFAVQNAAAELGGEIAIVAKAGEQVPVRATLVHLHGNANSDSKDFILRTEVIDAGWCGQWEQVVAQQVLGAPIVLFAGLGSAAPVLTATIGMIQGALGGNKILYQADIGDFAGNTFAAQLSISETRYIKGSWNQVTAKLAERIAAAQALALADNGAALLDENGYGQSDRERFGALAARFTQLPLLALGKMRAFADLDPQKLYRPHSQRDDELIAEPIVKLAQLAEQLGMEAAPTPGGTWSLTRDDRLVGHLVLASGGGVRRRAALEPRARRICNYIEEHSPVKADFILIGGIADGGQSLVHFDLISDEDPDDIIGGLNSPPIISANDQDFIDQVGVLLHAA